MISQVKIKPDARRREGPKGCDKRTGKRERERESKRTGKAFFLLKIDLANGEQKLLSNTRH